MDSNLSRIGVQMNRLTGVRAIMHDIVETLRSADGRTFIDLSAGNPVILSEVEALWRDCTHQLLASPQYGEVVCRYGSSQGYQPLIEAVAADFNRRYGLNLSERNVLITAGSQTLYFFAVNVFGGPRPDGEVKKVVLPLSPDYTGYSGVSLTPESLIAYRPDLEVDEAQHRFKYRPNLEKLKIDASTGCVLFSRPCNPTGNVLTAAEVDAIAAMAAPHGVPVFVDSAYAPPYPALNFTECTPRFADNLVHCMSLSKAGLPGERVGIAIGDERVVSTLAAFQANACIHASRYGQAIAAIAIAGGGLAQAAEQVIRPYYQEMFAIVEDALDRAMPADLPWFMHRTEGSIFAWLWLRDLPVTDQQLYQELKAVGVLVVPGSSFFPGLHEPWQHKHECIRISLTARGEQIVAGVQKIAQVVEQLYRVPVASGALKAASLSAPDRA